MSGGSFAEQRTSPLSRFYRCVGHPVDEVTILGSLGFNETLLRPGPLKKCTLSRQALPPVQSTSRIRRFSRWGQLLALLLAGGVLMQGLPVQTILSHTQQAAAHSECECHQRGVCPRNPDGSCTCSHSDPADSSADGPVLQSCDGGHQTAPIPASPSKWLSVVEPPAPSPRLSDRRQMPFYSGLSPRQVGDEVFRPPRSQAG